MTALARLTHKKIWADDVIIIISYGGSKCPKGHILESLPHSPNNTNQLDWSVNVLPKALTKYRFFGFSIAAIYIY